MKWSQRIVQGFGPGKAGICSQSIAWPLGGIVGLSLAWPILEKSRGARIAVLEKKAALARHQPGRNSGVIHSGIYYKPGSLKVSLCRAGGRRLVEFCVTHGTRHEVFRKVIVATSELELVRLNSLYERGHICDAPSPAATASLEV